MNILFVASPWLGGSGTVAYRMAKKLAENDSFNIHFLSYDLPYKSSINDGIKFHTLEGFNYPLFPFQLNEFALVEKIVELCVENDIQIIHSHYAILFGHACIMAKKILDSIGYKVSIVSTFHGSDVIGYDLNNPGKIAPRFLTAYTANQSDATTVASNTLKKILLDVYDIDNKVDIIPNFLDLDQYKVNKKQKSNTIVHISNFRPVKQPLVVAKVFEKVFSEHPNSELILIGDGPLLNETINYLENNNIKNYKSYGKIDNEKKLISILSKSKVLLLPSIFENFPLAALEAHACGVPVVGSNEGGIPELVINNETGFIAEKDDIDKMSEYTIKILKDTKLHDKLSKNARKSVEKYDTNQVISMYINLYKKIINKTQSNKNIYA